MYLFKAVLQSAIVFSVCAALYLSVSASTLNPSMGDNSGRYMWIFAVLAVVALVAVIVTSVMGKKGGKK